ncbi:MAG: hypothetical protein WA192_01795 [Candidatus Acidiferrales bacterium]
MVKWLLKSLLQSMLILIALVVVSATLPFASVWLCRDPVGGQVFFWVAPWTCAFWSILVYNLIGSKFWRGREAVEEWRARRGGYLRSVAKGTAWMFACLFLSYGFEFGVLWETHSPGWMPAAAYFPVAFTVVWCSRG